LAGTRKIAAILVADIVGYSRLAGADERWSLGFAQTAMALADAPDAQARIQGVIDAANGLHQVVRVLPVKDVSSQTYRIKSKAELFERSAKEYEILAVSLTADRRSRDRGGAAGRRSYAPTTGVAAVPIAVTACMACLRLAPKDGSC